MVSSYNLGFLVMWLPNDVFLTNHMLDAWGTSYLEKCNAWYMRPHGTEKPWKSCEEMKSHPIVSIWTHRGFMLEGMHAAPVLNPLEIIHGSPKQTRILPSRIRSVFRIDTPSKILTPYSGKTKIFLIEISHKLWKDLEP